MKLTTKAFFSPSQRFTFDQDGVRWVTDTHVVARADHVRTLTGIEHRDPFHLPLIQSVVHGQVVSDLGRTVGVNGKPEAYIVGTSHIRLHHDPGLWDAWSGANLLPYLALSASVSAPMVEWRDVDEITVGWTALRHLPPHWGLM